MATEGIASKGERESQVSRELGHLGESTVDLTGMVSELFGRLGVVLTKEPPVVSVEPDESKKEIQATVPLACEISDVTDSIKSEIARLKSLLLRLEI